VQEALESPEIKALQSSVHEKDRASWAVRAGYLPNLTLSVDSQHHDHGDMATEHNVALQITQKIFAPDTIAKNRIATTQKTLAVIALELEQARIQAAAEAAYLKAWLEQQRQKLINLSEQTAAQVLTQEQKKASLGLYTKLQSMLAESNFAGEHCKTIQYCHSLSSAEAALERALGHSLQEATVKDFPKLKLSTPACTLPEKN
jgi:outer membrane protein TolC